MQTPATLQKMILAHLSIIQLWMRVGNSWEHVKGKKKGWKSLELIKKKINS